LIKKNEADGSTIITKIEINNQISLHSIIVNRNTINNGEINSAKDKPNQVVLKARPLLLSKYLEIVVVAVCDINPWPDNLIKKIEKNNKTIEEILENKKQEIANKVITYAANFKVLISSIFFPIQTNIKLLNNVADA
tara:strand:+ start:722 stop:1132 length:411 start_codon:yes stop_codon:yes gene_type:complete